MLLKLDNDFEPLIPFEDLADLLLPLGCINGPAELHGMLCGLLCGGVRMEAADWLERAMEFLDVHNGAGMEVTEAVTDLYHITLAQFQRENYDLEIMVPGDDVDLDQRVLALSQWCHGFLSGLGSSGIDDNAELSPTSLEAIRDLSEIVQASIDDDIEDEEEAENDYFSVGEYVRIAVLGLYSDVGQATYDRMEDEAEKEPTDDDDEEDDSPIFH